MGISILKALRMLARAQSRSRVEQVAGVSASLDLRPPPLLWGSYLQMVPSSLQLCPGLNREGEKQGVGGLEGGSHLLRREPERRTHPCAPPPPRHGFPSRPRRCWRSSTPRTAPLVPRAVTPFTLTPQVPPVPSKQEPAVLGPGGAAERAAASASLLSLPLRQVKRRPPPPLRQVKRVGSPLSAARWLRRTPGRRPAPAPSLQPAPLGLGA